MSFNAIRENKILVNISESTVFCLLWPIIGYTIIGVYCQSLIIVLAVRLKPKSPFIVKTGNNGGARTLKKLRTLKGDYWIKQWFSSIASHLKMGTTLKG